MNLVSVSPTQRNHTLKLRWLKRFLIQKETIQSKRSKITRQEKAMDRLLAMNNRKFPFIRGKSPLHRAGKLGSISALLESDIIGTWAASYRHELVHDQCFVGNEEYGACAGCGFYSEKDEAQGPYDCIGCPEGYEIDVAFDDCTGFCVPTGTAETPISQSDCQPPGEFVDVVHFAQDGRMTLNQFVSGELVSVVEFTYRVDENQLLLSNPKLFEYAEGQLLHVAILGNEQEEWDAAMQEFDSNDNGVLDEEDFEAARERGEEDLPPSWDHVLDELGDTNNDGVIDQEEYERTLAEENTGFIIELNFELSDDNLTFLDQWPGGQINVRSDRPIVEAPELVRITHVDTLIGSWNVRGPWSIEIEEHIEFKPDGTIVRVQTDPDSEMTWYIQTAQYEFDNGLVREFNHQSFYFDQDNGYWVRYPQYMEEIESKVYAVDGQILIVPENFENPVTLIVGSSREVLVPEGIYDAVDYNDLPPPELDDYTKSSEFDGINGKLVFTTCLGLGGNCAMIAVDIDNQEQIVMPNGMNPAWSLDGNKLAFVKEGLFTSDDDGTNRKKLSDDVTSGFPAWSPDGNFIAFERLNIELLESDLQDSTINPLEIVVLDLIDNTEQVIKHGKWPSWSPDGKKIAYTHITEWRSNSFPHTQIEVTELHSGKIDTVASGLQSVWSPDGGYIAYARVDSSRTEDINDDAEQNFGPGSGMPVSIYVQEIETGDGEEEMVIASKQNIFSLFFFGGLRALHGWSADSEKLLYTEWEVSSDYPLLALYNLSTNQTTIIGNEMINPSWHDTDVSTVIEEAREFTVPESYELSQNYPNPFNGDTTIRFVLPRKQRVQIEVFNLLGQRIAEITDSLHDSGHHRITWDSSGLVSGCYLYVLKTADAEMVRKMMILK